jgi:acetyl esterase/lipase
LLVAMMTGSASAQEWENPANWESVAAPKATMDVAYFPADAPGYTPDSQRLDVYENAAAAGKKAPVLVYMHGGAWRNGKRPESWHGFRAWLAAGFSVVNVEYRLVDTVPDYAPAAVQDVACVLHWLKENAAKYNFDAERVVTYGTSAGGHLALMAAVLPKGNDIDLPQCRDQAKIVAVLDFYGPYHLEPEQSGAFTSPSTAHWMGPDPKPSLAAMEHAMSPSTYVRAGIPPVFQAHGDADPTVPYQASVELKKDLDKVGVKNAFDTVPGGGHGKWTPEENQRVDLDSLKFLRSVGVIP